MNKRGPYKRKPLTQRFWEKVIVTEAGCWEWVGAISTSGYGRISLGGGRSRLLQAHRVSWEIHNGSIPAGLWALHRCDNRNCVRPDHLFLGTLQDNSDDMVAKGRGRGKVSLGEAHPLAKLRPEQVLAIRADNRGSAELARAYRVSTGTIWQIRNRDTWRHL